MLTPETDAIFTDVYAVDTESISGLLGRMQTTFMAYHIAITAYYVKIIYVGVLIAIKARQDTHSFLSLSLDWSR